MNLRRLDGYGNARSVAPSVVEQASPSTLLYTKKRKREQERGVWVSVAKIHVHE